MSRIRERYAHNLSIDFLVIGHITRDIEPDGSVRLGGAATYASIAARRLGRLPAVVTSATIQDLEAANLDGIELCGKPSTQTTTFRNVYQEGARRQYLLGCAGCLAHQDVPQEWRQPAVALLAPVARELDANTVKAFPHSLTALSLQGLLRDWDSTGLVHARHASLACFLEGPQIAIASREDIGNNPELQRELERQPEIAVITCGRDGSTIREGRKLHRVPAFPAKEVDPTGAGDVFASAFVIAYQIYRDCWKAGMFASCAAALTVEHPGTAGIPTLTALLHRLRLEGIHV
jgi:1D-myo-inositol 3-kinase